MQHGLPYELQSLSFEDMDGFRRWKTKVESETTSSYVQRTGPKVCGTNKHIYFYCNRSGSYKAKGDGKRLMKTQGSCRINDVCTSYMNICQDMNSSHITVEYCNSHCGHECKLEHLRIPNHISHDIAAKLQLGVAVDHILDDIRGGYSESDGIGREHIVNRQDVLNIRRKLNIGSVQKHANDHASVCVWVKELQSKAYDPILVFKPQGSDGHARIGKEDFLLAFQTKFQSDVLKEYGNSVVCMDATHGTNMYDFQLITLLVIDAHGEGIPVAWAISNREDTLHITEFLSAVKSRVGDISPKVFMSDDADQYYKSWCTVMGVNSTKKLLCAWHVDRAWRKGLARHIQDVHTRLEVYHQLRVLLSVREETQFRLKVQQLISYLLEAQPTFCEYFQREYASPERISQWATFNRINSGVNTNMMLESFHRKLKVCYLQNKQNRRIDSLLNTMVRIARDLVFETLIKFEKGKQTHRQTEKRLLLV